MIGARQLTVPPLGELRKQGMGPYGPAYVGTPDEVIKMIEEELKVCPMTQIVFSIDSPGMDPRHMKRLDGTIRKGSHTSFPKSMSRGWNPSAPARVLAFFESLVSRSLDHQNETKLIAPVSYTHLMCIRDRSSSEPNAGVFCSSIVFSPRVQQVLEFRRSASLALDGFASLGFGGRSRSRRLSFSAADERAGVVITFYRLFPIGIPYEQLRCLRSHWLVDKSDFVTKHISRRVICKLRHEHFTVPTFPHVSQWRHAGQLCMAFHLFRSYR